jgi:hypothetical protein
MAVTPKHILIAGLGRYVSAAYEVGAKLGIQKSNKQIVLDVRTNTFEFPKKKRVKDLILFCLQGSRESQSSRL